MLKHRMALLTGIPRLYSWARRRSALIPAYHGIYDRARAPGRYPPTFVHVADFARQVEFFRDGYRILTPEEFLQHLGRGSGFPPNSVLITFDDGYESFDSLAWPVLRRYSIRPVVFLATGSVEEKEPFWFDEAWFLLRPEDLRRVVSELGSRGIPLGQDERRPSIEGILGRLKRMKPGERAHLIGELRAVCAGGRRLFERFRRGCAALDRKRIRALSASGVEFGGHTHSHTILSVLSEEEAKSEIVRNREIIQETTSKSCSFFAYPNGGPADFLPVHKGFLAEAGYRAAFSLTPGGCRSDCDPFQVPRYHVAPEDDTESLSFRFTGVPTPARLIRRVKRRDSTGVG